MSEKGPTQQARELLEQRLVPFAPSRTQQKKMAAAILDDWRAHIADVNGKPTLVLIRVNE